MRKIVRKCIIPVLMATAILGTSMTAYAAPKTMPDGQTFDPEFYAATYPDVVNVLGTDEAALYGHYVTYGKSEGRKPYADGLVTEQTLADADAVHNYYKNISDEGREQADAIAKQIADDILANADYKTDQQKVYAAAAKVAEYCNSIQYGTDIKTKWYRSPYGVFVGGIYTCAGSTRALGRVLDYMGFTWEHKNENQGLHQWCIVTMDGQVGFADGMGGFAYYGTMVSGMKLPNGRTIYFGG